ncbi:cytochrome P450 [Roridomyces roridus]|uniref:Cytochrome P450 n=1 Tax=Roridomyces roridus TaxID=1738132 RepID=A0AAD7B2D2_9AGAR|nr:cytochrome P450 [Roridomyces roridus]
MSLPASICLGLLLLLFTHLLRPKQKSLPLPPGPKGWPVLGNLADMPSDRQWETYNRWSKQLNSDIIHLNAAGTHLVIVSSMEAIKEIFEKRSALYSRRPRMPMINELMGWDFVVGFMNYGDRWRANCKLMHEIFNSGAAKQFYPQQHTKRNELLRRIAQDAGDILHHFRYSTGALVLSILYGIEVLPRDDPYLNIAEKAMHGLAIGSLPGKFLVDTFPLLEYVPSWMPGAGFKRQARVWKQHTQDILHVPFAETKRAMARGTAPPSFVSLHLNALAELDSNASALQDQESLIQEPLPWAGSFSPSNPEAQKRAQMEIDAVVGQERLPDFSDEPSLMYVSALVKEVLRWKIVVPIAIPHYLDVDDEYRRYRIPAGSIYQGPFFTMKFDTFPDPESFKPEQFLLSGKLNPAILDPESFAFGLGQRICPGRHLAMATLWLTITSILATLEIKKAVDKDGEVIEPSYEYFPGLISQGTIHLWCLAS